MSCTAPSTWTRTRSGRGAQTANSTGADMQGPPGTRGGRRVDPSHPRSRQPPPVRRVRRPMDHRELPEPLRSGDTGTAGYPSAQGACMSVVRTVVLPALRLLVWAFIAVALLALAFRGGSSDPAGAAGPGAPTLELSSPPVPVARGSVDNTVSVKG